VENVLRDAEIVLSSHFDAVSRGIAGRIWGFLSKFVMLDRFGKALGVADVYPGCSVPRKKYEKDYFGTASGVSDFLQRPDFVNNNLRFSKRLIRRQRYYKIS
jgi:hypothetical protein